MAEARQFEIFVRNARDEYITTVILLPSSSGGRVSHNGHEDPTRAMPSKCVVVDYTRDPEVLGTRPGATGALTMIAVKDHDKLKSFRGYLAARQKAGIATLPGGAGKLFFLPSVDVACISEGENIVGLLRTAAGFRPPGPPVQSTPAAPPPVTTADSRGGSGGGGGGTAIGGFLGSLMGTLSQTHKNVAGAAAVDRVNRAQEQAIRRKVERFKVEVREKLAAFAMDADPSTISHAFPHVEKSLRSIQHGLSEDFDGITSRTEGEVDNRHVVVYKLGYEPPEEEVQLDAQIQVTAPSRRAAPAANASLAPLPAIVSGQGGVGETGDRVWGVAGIGNDREVQCSVSAGDLVRIGTVVKDRRTVQDIEEESRQCKRRRGLGSGGGAGDR